MKKITAILLALMLVVALTIPASAAGINWGAAADSVRGAVAAQIRLDPDWLLDGLAWLLSVWRG